MEMSRRNLSPCSSLTSVGFVNARDHCESTVQSKGSSVEAGIEIILCAGPFSRDLTLRSSIDFARFELVGGASRREFEMAFRSVANRYPNYKVRIVRPPIYGTACVHRISVTTIGFLSVRSSAFALSVVPVTIIRGCAIAIVNE